MIRLEDDRVLLQAFRRGDGAALATVYRAYVRPLASMLREGFAIRSGERRVWFSGHRDPCVVEDLLQETFCRAFAPNAREGYDGMRPYLNFLFSIARNLVVDGLRSKAAEVVHAEDDLESSAYEVAHGCLAGMPPISPEEALLQADVVVLQKAFVDRLETADRELYLIRFQRGLSVADTAAALNISEHAVKSTERRLRHRFFVEMRESGFFDGYRYSRGGIARTVGVASAALCLSVLVALCLSTL